MMITMIPVAECKCVGVISEAGAVTKMLYGEQTVPLQRPGAEDSGH